MIYYDSIFCSHLVPHAKYKTVAPFAAFKSICLFKSQNCFAIYDKTFNLSHIEPDGPEPVCLKSGVKLKMINKSNTSRLLYALKWFNPLIY